jgi:hypothetical protein
MLLELKVKKGKKRDFYALGFRSYKIKFDFYCRSGYKQPYVN